MQRSPGPRKSAKLSESLHKSLNMYTLSAAAAGVGLSALALPSAAEIVYTPANTSIGRGGTVPLDLNHDGIVDFNFVDLTSRSFFYFRSGLSVFPAQAGNNIWGHSATGEWASALPPGFLVGPRGQFYAEVNRLMASISSDTGRSRAPSPFSACAAGGWSGVTNRYLALKFVVEGQTHFGWARLNVGCPGQSLDATLTGYAYETISDRPIITGLERYDQIGGGSDPGSAGTMAPKPASLGRLAQGASGLANSRDEVGTFGPNPKVR